MMLYNTKHGKIAIFNGRLRSFNELRLTNLVLEQPNIKLDHLKEVKIPVLVMAGQDDVVKEEHTRLISQSKLYIFPEAGHYVPIKFNKIILEFMLDK